ncbi:MAG: hypothetical protein COW32_02360 [Candidatus Aquicultor secundus]|uniref:Uncharacterized protein n=1 Tax=Candidatus Aquicultor secundus TaxID=1973895 RepID=A0A2M7T529_9ACTN|nr:hypothetical protein [Candidatus Aquicultor secundus]NCO66699.1 hypothetical protein [Solirubrobacter sp.]OIO87178.1 MAG: hypothetical protein AUK32_04245 [Candidatus Aquicultor secundus]PIU27074.1 MAG: hypothetical protein COT10_05315 [Candidatus Aquicultor secundus]PIW22856.1 MAG: hypothetical protein COW32_02360 [Candidatus Aquicultor secundus]PIX52557.1 MAG: hypothetical protein COZ51_03525 [Candidatus Aquicultor secundus]
MSYTKDELAMKLREMYKEINQHDLDMSLEFDADENAWVIHLKKGEHELRTFINKQDADECMNGIKCVYLGVQIGQFVQHFEEDEVKA